MVKIHVKYDGDDAKAGVFSDSKVEEWVRWTIEDFYDNPRDVYYTVGISTAITAYRVLVCEGVLDCEDIQFEYNGEVLRPDKNGRIAHWPNGFCDIDIDLLSRLL